MLPFQHLKHRPRLNERRESILVHVQSLSVHVKPRAPAHLFGRNAEGVDVYWLHIVEANSYYNRKSEGSCKAFVAERKERLSAYLLTDNQVDNHIVEMLRQLVSHADEKFFGMLLVELAHA